MGRLTGVLGIAAILGAAYLCSTDRRSIKLKTVAWGLGLQFVFAYLVLSPRTPLARRSAKRSSERTTRSGVLSRAKLCSRSS